MQKLSFEYDDRANEHTAEHRGFKVRAVLDSDAENPFTAWDGNPPTLVHSGRSDWNDYADGALANPLAEMSDNQMTRAWRAIMAALNIDADAYKRERDEQRKDYGQTAVETRRAMADDVLSDMRHGNADDYLEALATLWNLAGCVAVTWASNGYSQGDWATGLSVATPVWAKEVGAPKSSHKAQCEYAGKLWGFWAWGDVYGFVVETMSQDPDDDDGEAGEAGEELDSCWGFYGDDFEESGLAEAAREAIDGILAAQARAKAARLKELIRNRVPYGARSAILSQAVAEAAR